MGSLAWQAGLDAARRLGQFSLLMAESASLDSRVVTLKTADETVAFGRALGARLKTGDIICLWGGLGAGKTTLARGAVAAWTGRDEDVPSPTYTLVQIYEGEGGQLQHMDLYRLKSSEEAWELGLEDAFYGAACLIEWPERLGTLLPADRLDVVFETAGQDGAGRLARLTAHGHWRGRIDDL